MELPAALREGVERLLEGIPLADLKQASARLSSRYRAETRDGRLHLSDDLAAMAYLATRLPATFAAIRHALEMAAEADPDFAPASLLDVGAGPGSALWAASACWPSLEKAELLETSRPIRAVGSLLAAGSNLASVHWTDGTVETGLAGLEQADLVTLAYVLDELSPETGARTIETLWGLAKEMLVIVEPGTPAGWRRIVKARDALLRLGAMPVAPCAHRMACPVAAPDWCHFSGRVARSRMHRLAKGGEVPWEDEKFAFIAVARHPVPAARPRVLAPPRAGSGKVELKLCMGDGGVRHQLFTRRDGQAFKDARKLGWGDVLP